MGGSAEYFKYNQAFKIPIRENRTTQNPSRMGEIFQKQDIANSK